MVIDFALLFIALIVGFGVGALASCQLIIGLVFSAAGYQSLAQTMANKQRLVKRMSCVWGTFIALIAALIWVAGINLGAVLLAGYVLGSIFSALETLYSTSESQKQ